MAYNRQYYLNRKEKHYTVGKAWRAKPENREKINEAQRLKRESNRRFIDAIKLAAGCADCGYDQYAVALHFDHVSGEKYRSISEMQSFSKPRLLEEIMKCEVVCANCHSVRTHLLRDDQGAGVLQTYRNLKNCEQDDETAGENDLA